VVLAEGSPDALRAADDYAVIRLSSGARLLSLAADARDLFPFTHDRWTGDGIVIKTIAAGPAVRNGSETLGTACRPRDR
jgi:hypothetical protein